MSSKNLIMARLCFFLMQNITPKSYKKYRYTYKHETPIFIFSTFVNMSKMINLFPEITRPVEYVAIFNIKLSTMEGPAYAFLACDGYSEFGFQMCVEPDESPASIIKAVYLLTEDKDFARYMNKGFTLVFERWEELADRLETVVKPVNGKIMFNKRFHNKIAEPMLTSFMDLLKNGPMR